jgi:Flp pilus assembly protein TadD
VTGEPVEPVDGVEAYIQRADLLDDLGRYAEAADELREALRIEPDNPEALATLALIELRAGRAEQALAPAQAALHVRPDHLLGQVVRGHVLAELDRRQDAVDAADELLAADPESWVRQLHFAAIVRRVRNGQATLNAAWRAVQLAPDEPETHLVLAAVAEDLGLHEVAERAYAEAARLDPAATGDDRSDLDVLRLRPGHPPGHPVPPDDDPAGLDLAGSAGSSAGEPIDPFAAAGGSDPGGPLDDRRRLWLRRGFARLLSTGALYAWASPLVVVLMLVIGPGAARLTAAAGGALGVLLLLTARLPEPPGWVFPERDPDPARDPDPLDDADPSGLPGSGLSGRGLPRARSVRAVSVLGWLARENRWLAVAGAAVLAAPLMLLGYAVTGTVWPLGVVVLLGAFAFTVLVMRIDGTEEGPGGLIGR